MNTIETNAPMVHIVDDDEALRKSLSLLMRSEDIASQVYQSADEFLEYEAQNKLGCLLLDIRMPGMNGIELLDHLNSNNIKLPVVFITGHGDVSLAVQAMKAGAVDFIEKPFDNERLLIRVKDCLSQCVSINSNEQHQSEIDERIARLTNREKQVMQLLVEGKQNKHIARELNISSRTVEIHRSKVMKKLEAGSLSDVVRLYMLSTNYSS